MTDHREDRSCNVEKEEEEEEKFGSRVRNTHAKTVGGYTIIRL